MQVAGLKVLLTLFERRVDVGLEVGVLLEDGREPSAGELRGPLTTMAVKNGKTGIEVDPSKVVANHILLTHAITVKKTTLD